MNKCIEVVVAPTGEITVDALGFKGSDCAEATRFLEQALGVVQERWRKPEWHSRSLCIKRQQVGR